MARLFYQLSLEKLIKICLLDEDLQKKKKEKKKRWDGSPK